MNILYVCPFSHGVNISPELYMAHLMANRGNNVHFYTVKKSYVAHRNKDSKIASVPTDVTMHYINNHFLFSDIAYPLINPITEYRDLLNVIKNNNIDIVHFYFPEYLTSLPLLKKDKLNIPVILTVNGIPGYDWYYGNKYVDFIGKIYSKLISTKIIKNADLIIPSSSIVKNSLVKFGFKSKIIDISGYGGCYGVNTKFFTPCNKEIKKELRKKHNLPPNSFIIIYAGRLVQIKRLDLLIEAFSELKKNIKNLILLLVGDGPHKSYLNKLARKYDENHIKFINFVDQRTLSELYKASDMFILVSSGEGNPAVLLEASSSGLPLVTSNVGSTKDMITENFNGYILDDVNESNLVDRVLKIKNNHEKFSKNSRELALEKFSWNSIIEKYDEKYQEILNEASK